EFMSGQFIDMASRLSGKPCPIASGQAWYVLIESAEHASADGSSALLSVLEKALEDEMVIDCTIAISLGQSNDFWQPRQSIPEIWSTPKPTVNFDCGLPWKEMDGFITRADHAMRERYPAA